MRKREDESCHELRLVVIIGPPDDRDLDGAARFVIKRAEVSGGDVRIWQSRSTSSPLEKITDVDATGGQIDPDLVTVGKADFGTLLPELRECKGRITELTIFHHGGPVAEAEVGKALRELLTNLRVPVCRVVWWTCGAALSLDVSEGAWTDILMKALGGIARCKPCGCENPIELVWPTGGRCHLVASGDSYEPKTGDGQVNHARWGYPQPGGGIGSRPDPANPQATHNPPARDPPYNAPPRKGPGQVLGVGVGKF